MYCTERDSGRELYESHEKKKQRPTTSIAERWPRSLNVLKHTTTAQKCQGRTSHYSDVMQVEIIFRQGSSGRKEGECQGYAESRCC